jgi:hypothetical protein
MNVWKELRKSPLWRKPPLYKQIYLWLQIKADHGGYRVLAPGEIVDVEPGQIVTTLSRIAEENSWYVRGKKKGPNKKIVRDILRWFEKEGFAEVESNNSQTLITLVE